MRKIDNKRKNVYVVDNQIFTGTGIPCGLGRDGYEKKSARF